jgi:hypothetical protein
MGIVETLSKMSTANKMNAFALILIVATAYPLWVTLNIPLTITAITRGFYDAINQVPEGGVVVMGFMVNKFEQYKGKEDVCAAIWRSLHQRKLKVINLSVGPVAQIFFEDIYKRNKLVERYGLKYGEDYVITPYIAGEETALAAFAKDTWSAVSTDLYGTPISSLPLMQRVRSFNDVALGWMACYSASNNDQFIRQWGWAYNKPLIMSFQGFGAVAYAYPFPVKGVLDGIRGEAEFEFLTGFGGAQLAQLQAQSLFGLVYLVLLAGGFVGYNLIRTRKVEVTKE